MASIHNYLGVNKAFDKFNFRTKPIYNSRKGSTDEWLDFFSSDQLQLIEKEMNILKNDFPELQKIW